jgi:Fanconi anemia group M protein
MSQNKKLKLIVDNRERKLMELLDKKRDTIDYNSQQLDIADIIVSEDVAIERKEGFDFISSIMDNRLFEQLLRLKETYEKPILILEGLNDEVFSSTGMKLASIYGVLAKVSYVLGIAVIPTRNLDDTVVLIERIAFREQVKKNSNTILSRKAPKQMSLEERRTFIIEGLVDIGPKKAKALIEKFKTPYNVLRAIQQTEVEYTKTGNPKGIRGPLKDLGGFGWKFVENNKELLFGKKENRKQRKIDEI